MIIALLMIIDHNKKYMICVTAKDNIMVNRENRLIAHPYSRSDHNVAAG